MAEYILGLRSLSLRQEDPPFLGHSRLACLKQVGQQASKTGQSLSSCTSEAGVSGSPAQGVSLK